MADEYGFVYVLGNDSMPGLYKIGHTKYHPSIRAKELSTATGCPIPFQMLAYFSSDCASRDELLLHQELSKYRVNERREFFEAPPDIILAAFYKHSDYPHEATFFRHLSGIVASACYGMEVE